MCSEPLALYRECDSCEWGLAQLVGDDYAVEVNGEQLVVAVDAYACPKCTLRTKAPGWERAVAERVAEHLRESEQCD